MIQLKTIHYIDTDDVEAIVGRNWNECEFAEMAENDSYARLDCSDGALEELYTDLEWEIRKGNEPKREWFEDEQEFQWKFRRCRANRLRNQIKLVEELRAQGVRSEILIWICW